MEKPRQQTVEQAKAGRNAAHQAFRMQLAQVREDLSARGIGGRIVDRTGEAVSEAAEVANEHKAVVAGTAAALVAWFLRGPISRAAGRLWPGDDEAERKAEDD